MFDTNGEIGRKHGNTAKRGAASQPDRTWIKMSKDFMRVDNNESLWFLP